MMDNKKIMEQINQVVVDQYVRKLLVLKVSKLTLFNTFPMIGRADLSNASQLLMFDEPLEIARLLGPNLGN